MSIETPVSFAEQWGKNFADSTTFVAEKYEKELAPFMANFFSVKDIYEVTPQWILQLFGALKAPPHPALASLAAGFLGGVAKDVVGTSLAPEIRPIAYASEKLFRTKAIDFNTAIELYRRGAISKPDAQKFGSYEGYDDDYMRAQFYTEFQYPSIIDLMRWSRYECGAISPRQKLEERYLVEDTTYSMWDWLSRPRLDIQQLLQLYRRNILSWNETRDIASRIGWIDDEYNLLEILAFDYPNPSMMFMGLSDEDRGIDYVIQGIMNAGIDPEYAQTVYDALAIKPDIDTIVEHFHRNQESLLTLQSNLRRIGVHPRWVNFYCELLYPIPPIQDIITMAVREAFSPEIAARFGQYQDLPEDFVKYANLKGITREWAERYWAAHWQLPSAGQGFEMFQRGFISHNDLIMLLRALDVMPFWRDKLINIAYAPLTRVDIRRMYQEKVIKIDEVYRAYLDTGYSAENATRLTDYTIKYATPDLTTISKAQVISAYKNGLESRDNSREFLISLHIEEWAADFLLDVADYDLWQEYVKDRIAAIKNLYSKGAIYIDDVRRMLSDLQLAPLKIQNYIDQWYKAAEEDKVVLFTKAEVLGYFAKGLMSDSRTRQELSQIGYNSERIGIIMAGVAV